MFDGNRVLFNYVQLTCPNGGRFFTLPELIGHMQEATGEGENMETGEKQKIRITIIRTPFGHETVVMETPEQIMAQLQRATTDAVVSMHDQLSKKILVAGGKLAKN